MEAGNCVSPHMAAGNGLHSPMQVLSDSAALLERFARTNFRTRCNAAGERRGPPRVDHIQTRRNYKGRC